MITQEEIQKITETTKDFLEKMSLTSFVVEVLGSLDTAEVNITLEEPQILIGQDGKTLLDLQRLLGIVLCKMLGRMVYIKLDINGYRAQKLEHLKKMAQEAADQVVLTKQSKIFLPMSSYERRIIHAELAQRQDVLTQSQGEGLERCVVVVPK